MKKLVKETSYSSALYFNSQKHRCRNHETRFAMIMPSAVDKIRKNSLTIVGMQNENFIHIYNDALKRGDERQNCFLVEILARSQVLRFEEAKNISSGGKVFVFICFNKTFSGHKQFGGCCPRMPPVATDLLKSQNILIVLRFR